MRLLYSICGMICVLSLLWLHISETCQLLEWVSERLFTKMFYGVKILPKNNKYWPNLNISLDADKWLRSVSDARSLHCARPAVFKRLPQTYYSAENLTWKNRICRFLRTNLTFHPSEDLRDTEEIFAIPETKEYFRSYEYPFSMFLYLLFHP